MTCLVMILMLRLATPGRRLIDFRGLWTTDVPFNTPFSLGVSLGRPFVSTAIEEIRDSNSLNVCRAKLRYMVSWKCIDRLYDISHLLMVCRWEETFEDRRVTAIKVGAREKLRQESGSYTSDKGHG